MRKGPFGFTLIEVTIILMVLAILGLIMLPMVDHWVKLARVVKVREDLLVLGSTIPMMLLDIGESCFWLRASTPGVVTAGTGGFGQSGPPIRSDANRIELLISNGDIPSGNGAGDVIPWLQPYSIGFGQFDVDFLEYHLCSNTPGAGVGTPYRRAYPYPPTVGASLREGFARTNYGYFNSAFGWRGAYMTAPISSDPWGNRYMVNVQFLDSFPDTLEAYQYMAYDVFILSAGSNETVETPYAMDGAYPFGDDEIFVISGGGH